MFGLALVIVLAIFMLRSLVELAEVLGDRIVHALLQLIQALYYRK